MEATTNSNSGQGNINNETFTAKGERKVPCRACTDFKTWAKHQGMNFSSILGSSRTMPNHECPLDKDELGRNTWSLLHTMAAYYPDKPSFSDQEDMKKFVTIFSKFYPCDYCAADLRENSLN
ncbi:FAD-linked sulfhydryl oxidase ALR-like [Limulus polyphemus]|uniref:Sulfhydryl oxidase n=1 Tax=Limulus polyphemus TaxID=6850 RepID=A0ABM1BVN1_LIMPO|nr:FAD-linked sulfhydryl oxidase ALR-like [Limulus polyphemus]